jgi:hypothetical protein
MRRACVPIPMSNFSEKRYRDPGFRCLQPDGRVQMALRAISAMFIVAQMFDIVNCETTWFRIVFGGNSKWAQVTLRGDLTSPAPSNSGICVNGTPARALKLTPDGPAQSPDCKIQAASGMRLFDDHVLRTPTEKDTQPPTFASNWARDGTSEQVRASHPDDPPGRAGACNMHQVERASRFDRGCDAPTLDLCAPLSSGGTCAAEWAVV